MVWEMAPLVKCLSHKYKGLTLILRTQVYKVRSPASVGRFRGEGGILGICLHCSLALLVSFKVSERP